MRPLALLLMLMLTAACTSPSSLTGQNGGSEDAPPQAETTTSLGRLGLEQVSLEFSGCMREQGISIPDLRFDSATRPVLGDLSAVIDTSSSEFRDALAACALILVDAGALDLRSDPELQAEVVRQLEVFTACARAGGLVSFPDPDPGFTGIGPAFPSDELPIDLPGYQAVVESCRAFDAANE